MSSIDLPSHMTWEELERLPAEVAGEIELWEGRVVRVHNAPLEHQEFTALFWAALRQAAQAHSALHPDECLRPAIETNVFLGESGKSDFVTPDFFIVTCRDGGYDDVRASEVHMVGEVLSRANTPGVIEEKKARYAAAGIPWYWEVTLSRNPPAVQSVRIYGLESAPGALPAGVHPLRPTNYLLVRQCRAGEGDGIEFEHPIPIRIPWSALRF